MNQPELIAAVEHLYDVFAKYSRPLTIKCCPCGCTKPDATNHLVAVPLREIPFADMLDYCFSAITTQGSVDDFKYLLPRLMQGISEEPCGCNPEILFGKLRIAKWLKWPDDEIRTVQAYLRASWHTALNTFPIEERMPAFCEIETVLASIAVTGEDLEWFLNTWTLAETQEADRNLVQFVTMFGDAFSEGRTFHEAFWAESLPQAIALRDWLLRNDTLQRLQRSTHLLPADGFEQLFQPALEGLLREAAALHSE
jgi:hypothetical protein